MPDFIACVGHAAVDHHFEINCFPTQPTKTPAHAYKQIVGGMAANAAMGLAQLGASVRLLGRVGSDEAGDFIKTELKARGIDERLERVPDAYTSVSTVIVDQHGERQIFNHRGNALTQAHCLATSQLEGAQAVLVDPRWSEGSAAALIWAREHRLLSVLDADIAPQAILHKLVPLAQWAVFSEPGLHVFAPEASYPHGALQAALNAGAQVAMVTLGERGVAWQHAGQPTLHTLPAFRVKAVDTTGAGDVFHAALTWALSQLPSDHGDTQVHTAVRFASAAAALKCEHGLGALGAPSLAQVQKFLDTHAAY